MHEPQAFAMQIEAVTVSDRSASWWGRERATGPLVVAVVAVAMLTWTWGRWLNLLVDFGGELYVAWRIAAGEVLYRDLAYFTGPLSPYVNALWFSWFGTGLWTLVVANLVLVGLLTALLYRLLAILGDRLSATVGCVVFLVAFAFSTIGDGNYNFVCPYSHEALHGTLLALAALSSLGAWLRSGRSRWILCAGAMLGLCFLTKGEIFVALALALATGLCV